MDELPRRVLEDVTLARRDVGTLMRPRGARGGGFDDDYGVSYSRGGRAGSHGGATGSYGSQSVYSGATGNYGNQGGYGGAPRRSGAQAGSAQRSVTDGVRIGGMRPQDIPGVTRGMPIVRSAAADVSAPATIYSVGDRVQHRKFGPGTVIASTGGGNAARVRIEFDDGRVSEFATSVAPIIKLG